MIDQWISLQRTWMYLEPIFSSDDIMQQLPLEGKRFATVDRSWRKTLDAAKRSPGVLKVSFACGNCCQCLWRQAGFRRCSNGTGECSPAAT